MRAFVGLIVIGATLAGCLAECQPGLHGLASCYRCEGITDLTSQLPADATGLDIRNSNISRIPADAFAAQGATLLELNITGCGVETIEPNAFRGLSSLRVLGLVDNKIRKVEASWTGSLRSLTALLIWRNRINEIEPAVYDSLSRLEVLDIAYNELRECLTAANLGKLKRLKLLLLGYNPWSYRCRPDMTWFIGSHHIQSVRDWTGEDIIIEECLAHEPGADADDDVLNGCVDGKLGLPALRSSVAALDERVRRLTDRVTRLESEIASLKKSA